MTENMSMVGQLLFAGLSIGGVYALVALGFVMIFRATNVVNFAQGEFAMLGAYALVALWQGLNLDYFMAIVLALVIMAGVGLLFEITIYYPLRNRSFLPVIIATIGASIMFQNGALAVFGPSPEKVRPVFGTDGGASGITLGGVFFDYQYLVILVVTALLVGLQYIFFEYTILGGLGMGVIESFGAAYISAVYKDGFSFLVLIVFLLLRPQGIFGEKVAEKA